VITLTLASRSEQSPRDDRRAVPTRDMFPPSLADIVLLLAPGHAGCPFPADQRKSVPSRKRPPGEYRRGGNLSLPALRLRPYDDAGYCPSFWTEPSNPLPHVSGQGIRVPGDDRSEDGAGANGHIRFAALREKLLYACNAWAAEGYELVQAHPEARDMLDLGFEYLGKAWPADGETVAYRRRGRQTALFYKSRTLRPRGTPQSPLGALFIPGGLSALEPVKMLIGRCDNSRMTSNSSRRSSIG
jgi:hypothetical protein